MVTRDPDQKLILINEEALSLAPDAVEVPKGARVIVAGRSLVQMTLAELAVPGAQMIWTDFRQSASLSALHSTVQSAGGLDRLVMAADGSSAEAMFSLMCAVLTFLPALRRRQRSEIVLMVEAGAAVTSLVTFLGRIDRKLTGDGIVVTLRIRERREVRALA